MARRDARDVIKSYEEAKSLKSHIEHDCRMAAAHCLPRQYAAWQTDGPVGMQNRSDAPRRIAYDGTGARSLPKYVSLLHRLATPSNQYWQEFKASDEALNRNYNVKKFFEALRNRMFTMRRSYRSRFGVTRGSVYQSIGVYGNAVQSVLWRPKSHLDPDGGFAFKAWPFRDVFILTDDNDNIAQIFRRFWLNARQFRLKFPNGPTPKCIKAAGANPNETSMFEFVQHLFYREGHDPKSLRKDTRHPVGECYIAVQDGEYVGEEDGYQSMPLIMSRSPNVEAGDVYGYSVAMQALPGMGGSSAMKKTMLKQGHKAVDPPILAADDGVISGRIDIRPGRVTHGAVNSAGQRLVVPMEMGKLEIGEKLLQDERADIEDNFLVTLFRVLEENPSMTATQVVELMASRGTLLAPTMEAIQSEDLGPMTEREIVLMSENDQLIGDLQMPAELIEAKGQYTIEYTSPLAKAMRAEEAGGAMKWIEFLTNVTNMTKDPAWLDHVMEDEAAPFIAEAMAVPHRMITSPDQLREKRAARQKAQQEQATMEQAPAIASVVNTAMKQDGSGTPGVSN